MIGNVCLCIGHLLGNCLSFLYGKFEAVQFGDTEAFCDGGRMPKCMILYTTCPLCTAVKFN